MTNMLLNPEAVSCPEKGHPAPRGRGHAQHSVCCHPNARRSDNSHASTRIPMAFLCSLLADQLETQSSRYGSTGTGAALSTIPREPTPPAPAPPVLRLSEHGCGSLCSQQASCQGNPAHTALPDTGTPTARSRRDTAGPAPWLTSVSFFITFQNLKQIVPHVVKLIKPVTPWAGTAGVDALWVPRCLINTEHKLRLLSPMVC